MPSLMLALMYSSLMNVQGNLVSWIIPSQMIHTGELSIHPTMTSWTSGFAAMMRMVTIVAALLCNPLKQFPRPLKNPPMTAIHPPRWLLLTITKFSLPVNTLPLPNPILISFALSLAGCLLMLYATPFSVQHNMVVF
jgi:hypothetical protein